MLRSPGLPKEVRRARGLALKELGGIFLDAAAAHLEVMPAQSEEQVRRSSRSVLSKRTLAWLYEIVVRKHQCYWSSNLGKVLIQWPYDITWQHDRVAGKHHCCWSSKLR